MNKKIASLLTLLLTSTLLFAQLKQVPLDPSSTDNLAELFRQKYDTDRARAEQMAKQLNIELRKELPNGGSMEFEGFDDNGQMMFMRTYNIGAGRTTSTNKVWPGGTVGTSLTGGSVVGNRLGMWDGGRTRTTHREFSNRATQVDNASTLSAHATHVAATMVAQGVTTNARGMAYEANIRVYDWNNDNSEMASAAGAGMLISNHSYGTISGWHVDGGNTYWYGDESISSTIDWKFGFYDTKAQQWDQIAVNNPFYLIVKAAGNDRGSSHTGSHLVRNSSGQWVTSTTPRATVGPFDCLPMYSTAKNILTVGAVRKINNSNTNNGWTKVSDVVMTSFSGWGPTDDGRIKPDVVGCGESVNSANSTADDSYTTMNGTSMASPNVSGSLFLVQQHYQNIKNAFMRSATLKALAIHTADEAGNPGPDYSFGWGLLNTAKAIELITDSFTNAIQERTLNNGATITQNIMADGGSPLRITICWTDRAGTPVSAALNPPNLMLVNDLDLRLRRLSDNTVFMPYILDPANPSANATTGDNNRDNVEQILIQAPEPGVYVLTVSHKSSLAAGQAQAFSLIMSGLANIPSAEFIANNTRPCTNQTVSFTDQSTGGSITSRIWYFIAPNGDVITSTLANPSRQFTIPGNYAVALRVTNFAGTDSIYKPNYIISGGLTLPFLENFENESASIPFWSIVNPNNDTTWRRVEVPNKGEGYHAMMMPFYDYGPQTAIGRMDFLISPVISLRNFTVPALSFDHSYQRYTNYNYDSLYVSYTQNCNANPPASAWIRIGAFSGPNFTTVADDSTYFIPSDSSQWCQTNCRTINLPSAIIGASNVRFRFEAVNRWGNNLYIDNIRITGNGIKPIAGFRTSSQNLCTNVPITFTDTSRNFPTSWLWEISGPQNFTFHEQSFQLNFTQAGSYSIKLTVANSGGTDSIIRSNFITVVQGPQIPNIVSSANVICSNDSIRLYSDSASELGYNWMRNNSVISGASSNQIYVILPGVYVVQAQSGNGCIANSSSINLSSRETPSKPLITSSLTNNQVCNGGAGILTSSAMSGNIWFRNGNVIDGAARQLNISIGGSYAVQVNDSGCIGPLSDILAIATVPSPPAVNVEGPTLVKPESEHVYTVNGMTGSTYSWTITGGTRSPGNTNQITITWGNGTTGKITVRETNPGGCSGPLNELDVTLSPNASVNGVSNISNTLGIYPNPAHTSSTLTWINNEAGMVSIELYDVLGKVVLRKSIVAISGENTDLIDLAELCQGVYHLRISQGIDTATRTLIIKR
jgi:PKD repeat protein